MSIRKDIAVATLFLVLGVLIIIESARLSEGTVPDPIGTGGLPGGVGMVVVALALAIIGRRLQQRLRHGQHVITAEGATDEPAYPVLAWRPLAIWTGAVVYVATVPVLGFLVATPLLLGGVLLLMDVRRWTVVVPVAVGFTAVAYALFDVFLKVDLP